MIIDTRCGLAFIVFGLICLLSGFILSSGSGKALSQIFSAEGGKFGPIIIRDDNEVLDIKIFQEVSDSHWSSVEAELVDESGNYLFAFGDELWSESGRDADGYWHEDKFSYELTTTFPKAGQYFINVASNNSQVSSVGTIHVRATPRLGSSVAYTWLGALSIILGLVALYFFTNLRQVLKP